MVLLKTTVAGFALLVLGILLLTLGAQYVTVVVQDVQRTTVEPHAEFLVGDLVDKSYNLPASVQVLGNVSVTEAPSNQTGAIRFLVFDSDNYQKWTTVGQADSAYSGEKQGQFSFTFTTAKSDVYHFVSDNRASLYKKYVTLTITYDDVVTSRVPDTRVGYVGWVFVAAGLGIALYGLVRKPPVKWA